MNRMIENESSYISNKMNMSKKKIDFYFFCFVYLPSFYLILKANDPCLNLVDFGTRKNLETGES